jgi:hypothetical protein
MRIATISSVALAYARASDTPSNALGNSPMWVGTLKEIAKTSIARVIHEHLRRWGKGCG